MITSLILSLSSAPLRATRKSLLESQIYTILLHASCQDILLIVSEPLVDKLSPEHFFKNSYLSTYIALILALYVSSKRLFEHFLRVRCYFW
jgi:hypothetical protein